MEYEEVEVNSERWFDLTPLLNEEFRDIKGYEGIYQVSNYGRVKSLKRATKNQYGQKDMILKNNTSKCNYLFVRLNSKNKLVHRLVAETFIININNKSTVNHKDGNKQNNCVDNLEWSTHKEQTNHAIKIGLINIKGRNWSKFALMGQISNSKKVLQYDLYGKLINEYKSLAEAERITGINHGNISMCCNYKYKKAGGYIWRFKEGK
jgi:hypothetical protein